MDSQAQLVFLASILGALVALTATGLLVGLSKRAERTTLAAVLASLGLLWVTAILSWNLALLVADARLARLGSADLRDMLFSWIAIAPGIGGLIGSVLGLLTSSEPEKGKGQQTSEHKAEQTAQQGITDTDMPST